VGVSGSGIAAASGQNGLGGAGVVGSGITVINNTGGTISGGLGGDGVTLGNAISFTGGSNTLTLGGGTLAGNIGLSGSASVSFNQSTSQLLSNNITGTGSIIDEGTGTLTLSGANSYSGTTEVMSGSTLIVNGSNAAATGTVTVDSGGMFGGTGILGGNLVNNGTLMIDPGTMTVNGNYSGSGSFIEEMKGMNGALSYDKLIVSGMATLSGQTLVYDPIAATPATHYTNGAAFAILTAGFDFRHVQQCS
jgi:autotransporter-associated beta strand protein